MEYCGCTFYLWLVLGLTALTLSPAVRYYGKIGLFFSGSMILAILPIPQFILRPRDYRNALLPAYGCQWLLRLLGVSYELRGIEHIQRDRGNVVLINHQSSIDLCVLAYLWPVIGRATVVAKKELFYAFPFGLAAYLWGTLFIDRADPANALHKLGQESRAIRDNAAKLLFFPEGTRHQGDKLLPFKKGAFHIAVQSESAVQPVVVSRYHFLDKKRKIFGRGHCIVQILPEIPCNDLSKDDVPALLEKTQQLMQAEYDKLNAEMRTARL